MTETPDITVQLTGYLHRLAESTRIDSDLEGVVSNQPRPMLPDHPLHRTTTRFVTRAAVILLLVGGVGLLVTTTRSDGEPPPTSDIPEPTPSAPRLLAPADLPAAFEPVVAEMDARVSFESDVIERIYSAVDVRFEEGPTLSVVAYDAERAEPQVEADAIDVQIQGTSGSVWSPGPSQERVRFGPIDARWYLLTGYGLDRTALLALAETVTAAPDGFGAVADSSQFSGGMEEIAAGVRYGNTFIARRSLNQPIRHASWTSDSGSFEYFVTVDGESAIDAGRLSFGRDVYDTVRDIEINGARGVVASGQNVGGIYTTVYWSTGTETVSLTSRNLSETDTVAIAESMRPTSREEWPR